VIAVIERKTKASGGFSPEDPAELLLALLDMSLGNPVLARAAVAHALANAGRADLPQSPVEMLSFVRAHLTPILTSELGPRLTLTLLDDLEAKLDPEPVDSAVRAVGSSPPVPSEPPPSTLRRIGTIDFRPQPTPPPATALGVLVVDPDRIGRPSLARALLRAKWGVTVVDTPAEVSLAFDGGEDFAVALVHTDHPHAVPIVVEVLARYPGIAVVARCRDLTGCRKQLSAMGVAHLEVRAPDAPPEELVETIRRTLGM
jgi:hypothetical protein